MTHLCEVVEAFARLSAVYGGTYMLNKPGCEVVYDDAGRAVGVRSERESPHELVAGEWIGAEIRLQTPLLAQYAVSHYLEQNRVLEMRM